MAKNILLVDDELDMVAVTKARLESAGYGVTAIESAEEALVWLKKNNPDLILLDLLLQKMQGEELCKLLRADEKFRKLPVILFTASASDIPKVTREIEANDYIMKPYEPGELLKKIKALLKE